MRKVRKEIFLLFCELCVSAVKTKTMRGYRIDKRTQRVFRYPDGETGTYSSN
jgi:hypothetical protein